MIKQTIRLSFVLAACSIMMLGQASLSNQVNVSLLKFGWQEKGIGPDVGSTFQRLMDFSDDGTLWIAYPSENNSGLINHENVRPHRMGLMHVSDEGAVITHCSLHIPSWRHIGVFARASGGVIIESASTLYILTNACDVKSEWTPPKTGEIDEVMRSPDGTKIYAWIGSKVFVLSSTDGTIVKVLGLSTAPQRIFADSVFSPAVRTATSSCWRDEISRVLIANDVSTPWTTLLCSEYMLLDDNHLLTLSGFARRRLRMDLKNNVGLTIGSYIFPKETTVSLAATSNSRDGFLLAVPIVDSKAQETVVVIDLLKQAVILSEPTNGLVGMRSFALNNDGHRLALLEGDRVKIYKLPPNLQTTPDNDYDRSSRRDQLPK